MNALFMDDYLYLSLTHLIYASRGDIPKPYPNNIRHLEPDGHPFINGWLSIG